MLGTVRSGVRQRGGIVSYPLDQLHQEVAYIAYHFHWDAEELLTMSHPERRRWVREIAAINERFNEQPA